MYLDISLDNNIIETFQNELNQRPLMRLGDSYIHYSYYLYNEL